MGDEVIREAERDLEKKLDAVSEFTGVSKKRILQILINESNLKLVFNRSGEQVECVSIGTDEINLYGIRSNL